MEFVVDKEIHKRIKEILKKVDLPHVKVERIVCFRSTGSRARARARIWSLPRIWQKALGVKPHYCIEILTEKFDSLPYNEQTKVLIHELLHIPKTFSGALLNHRSRGRRLDRRVVEKIYKEYKRISNI